MSALSDLRALLERALTHAENPAIQRLEARCSFSVDCNPHGAADGGWH